MNEQNEQDEAKSFIELHSTRCPNCESPRHTSRLPEGAQDFSNMYNHCMECGHDFTPDEALPSLARVEQEDKSE